MSMANRIARIPYLTNVDFCIGALNRLAEALHEAAMKRPLLITEDGLELAGLAERTTIAMGKCQPAAAWDWRRTPISALPLPG